MINYVLDKVLLDTSQVMMLVTMGKVFSVKIYLFKVTYNVFCTRYTYSLVFAADMYGKIGISESSISKYI